MTGPRALVVAAVASGVGKTTITLGLLGALARSGVRVAAAKSGPDYIDPRFHDATLAKAGEMAGAAARPSATLDAWAMDADALCARAAAQAAGAELLIVEGAMGALDGAAGPGACGVGSAADLAQALGAPLLLVVDAAKRGASAAVDLAGLRALRPELSIAGVALNRVGSARHERLLRRAFAPLGVPVLGAAPRLADLETPSRHLGLTPAGEAPALDRFLDAAADAAAQNFDLAAVVRAARPVRAACAGGAPRLAPLGQRVAVASDIAFAFAYPHLLDDWRAQGAELSFFSPLADEAPDGSADAVFLPGGFPELHAPVLAAAGRFRAGVAASAARGAQIYGECGGYMALGDGLVDAKGRRWPMCGLLPVETRFDVRTLQLGYRSLRPRPGAPFQGALAAHEHHWSTVASEGDAEPLFDAWDAEGAALGPIGRRVGRVSGSYAHVIAPASPA